VATKKAVAKASAKKRRAARPPRQVVLGADELAALTAAQRRYLGWRTGEYPMAPVDRSTFTSLREAAGSMRKALAPFVLDDAVNPDAARLLALVQEADGFTADQSTYRTYLARLSRVLALLEAACSVTVNRGIPMDERAYLWVCCAADELLNTTGRRPTSTSVTRTLALFSSAHPAVPAVSASQVRAALTAWRRFRADGSLAPKQPGGES
jgi:hypothetical protein